MPAEHGVHSAEDIPDAKKPGAHFEHSKLPRVDANRPTSQPTQEAAPAPENVPGRQEVHAALPVCAWNEPVGQSVQPGAPSPEYLPSSQAKQATAGTRLM